jgi:YaiO family outer membrane protein
MQKIRHHFILLFGMFLTAASAQDMNNDLDAAGAYNKAEDLAFNGDIVAARGILEAIDTNRSSNAESGALLARIYSWEGDYDRARERFNMITSNERGNADAWIAAIKNELYANNDATALGLANKALIYLKENEEVARLRDLALKNIEHHTYTEWETEDVIKVPKTSKKAESPAEGKAILAKNAMDPTGAVVAGESVKADPEKTISRNRVAIANSFSIFDAVYDPMVFSSISYRRQTKFGSIIPRINYSNRLNKNGIQYDLDLYPKLAKRLYAYLNYGYSRASIYPRQKVGGDLYANLPGAIEVSAGMRYINFDTRNITVVTNSLGYYHGNYYFSLRSYITPQPNNLTRVSGNLLVRKYLKDAESFFGVNAGMGYSPELRQLRDGDELLSETLLYIESQRLSFEYQFSAKNTPNIYRANLGVTRQELVFDTGNFFWSISAGITYQVQF